MSKKIVIIFILILTFSSLATGEILVRVGVLNIDQLLKDYPESRIWKEKLEKYLDKKHYFVKILKTEKEYINNYKPKGLSSMILYQSKKARLRKLIKILNDKRMKSMARYKKGGEKGIKRKLFFAIKQTRRKKGFGIIISSKRKMILFYDEKLDFNPFVLEELMPEEDKK